MPVIQLSIKTPLAIYFLFGTPLWPINVIWNIFLILINALPPSPHNTHINALIMFHVINKKLQTVLPLHGIPMIELLPISRCMSTHYQMTMSSSRVSYIERSGVSKSHEHVSDICQIMTHSRVIWRLPGVTRQKNTIICVNW